MKSSGSLYKQSIFVGSRGSTEAEDLMESRGFLWESEYLWEAEYPWEAPDHFECHFSFHNIGYSLSSISVNIRKILHPNVFL